MRVAGYVRVSSTVQERDGAGLEAQRRTIIAEAERRGFEVVEIFTDTQSGKTANRPGLVAALDALESGGADVLMVAKLDRLSRSVKDFAALMDRSRSKGWRLVALDLGVDTTTPAGEMMLNVMASFAQFERQLIGQRTREGLAVKRSQGVRLGRPPMVPHDVRQRVQTLRGSGLSLQRIADRLNAENVPTAHGGERWHKSTVHSLLAVA